MAKIIPFKGIRYNTDLISDISLVTAPPYDVISKKEQINYYNKHENNIIRLILGQEKDDDTPENNKYTRSSEYLNNWFNKNILKMEDSPSIYLYSQEYKLKDEETTKIRHGFIALVKLEDFSTGVICPHEQTLSKPKKDRLELMRKCNTNFSQIFGLYTDKEFNIEKYFENIYKTEPEIKVKDNIGVVNYMWRVTDPDIINKFISVMQDKSIVIADGHHRYETALNYQKERIEKNPQHTGNEPYNYIMFMLVNTEDSGLTILPTHRLLHNLGDINIASILNEMTDLFKISKINIENKNSAEIEITNTLNILREKNHTFAMYAGNNIYYLLSLKDEHIAEELIDHTKSKAWRKLDVAILQNLIIERYFDVENHHVEEGTNLVYSHEFEECIEKVDSGEFQIALFLNPTKNDEVMQISGHGELMPQKSTYFYPKLLSGLVFNKL